MNNISKQDVLQVAKELNFIPTEEQVSEVIERFEDEVNNDPTGCLPLWIENLLYSIGVKQNVSPKN
jgi:Ca2+-binding EF-hand superfamily protein